MASVIVPPVTPGAFLLCGAYGADVVLFAGGALNAIGVKDGAPFGAAAALALLVLCCAGAAYKKAAMIVGRA